MAPFALSMTLHRGLQSPAVPPDKWCADMYYRMFSWNDDYGYVSPCGFPYSLVECTRFRPLSLRSEQPGDFEYSTTWRLLVLAA